MRVTWATAGLVLLALVLSVSAHEKCSSCGSQGRCPHRELLVKASKVPKSKSSAAAISHALKHKQAYESSIPYGVSSSTYGSSGSPYGSEEWIDVGGSTYGSGMAGSAYAGGAYGSSEHADTDCKCKNAIMRDALQSASAYGSGMGGYDELQNVMYTKSGSSYGNSNAGLNIGGVTQAYPDQSLYNTDTSASLPAAAVLSYADAASAAYLASADSSSYSAAASATNPAASVCAQRASAYPAVSSIYSSTAPGAYAESAPATASAGYKSAALSSYLSSGLTGYPIPASTGYSSSKFSKVGPLSAFLLSGSTGYPTTARTLTGYPTTARTLNGYPSSATGASQIGSSAGYSSSRSGTYRASAPMASAYPAGSSFGYSSSESDAYTASAPMTSAYLEGSSSGCSSRSGACAESAGYSPSVQGAYPIPAAGTYPSSISEELYPILSAYAASSPGLHSAPVGVYPSKSAYAADIKSGLRYGEGTPWFGYSMNYYGLPRVPYLCGY